MYVAFPFFMRQHEKRESSPPQSTSSTAPRGGALRPALIGRGKTPPLLRSAPSRASRFSDENLRPRLNPALKPFKAHRLTAVRLCREVLRRKLGMKKGKSFPLAAKAAVPQGTLRTWPFRPYPAPSRASRFSDENLRPRHASSPLTQRSATSASAQKRLPAFVECRFYTVIPMADLSISRGGRPYSSTA